jgi:prepilin-type N-terminal cleavage/methylation domain-containing protein
MAYSGKNAFTLIELIMVIAIIGILSVSGAWLMAYFVKDSVYIPNQLNADMAASDAIKIIIEGDNQAKGLRFIRLISAIPNNNQITFTNQDNQSISYRLDLSANKLYRSVSGAAEAQIPYYAGGNVNIAARSGALFTCYDANEAVTTVPANVRRIAVNLVAATGSGSSQDWQGQSVQGSSITVNKFQ